jgi:hypothetical protein
MKSEILMSFKEDFHDGCGPSQTTTVSLSLDGMLFEVGRFYEGPGMAEYTGERLKKLREFKMFLSSKE